MHGADTHTWEGHRGTHVHTCTGHTPGAPAAAAPHAGLAHALAAAMPCPLQRPGGHKSVRTPFMERVRMQHALPSDTATPLPVTSPLRPTRAAPSAPAHPSCTGLPPPPSPHSARPSMHAPCAPTAPDVHSSHDTPTCSSPAAAPRMAACCSKNPDLEGCPPPPCSDACLGSSAPCPCAPWAPPPPPCPPCSPPCCSGGPS